MSGHFGGPGGYYGSRGYSSRNGDYSSHDSDGPNPYDYRRSEADREYGNPNRSSSGIHHHGNHGEFVDPEIEKVYYETIQKETRGKEQAKIAEEAEEWNQMRDHAKRMGEKDPGPFPGHNRYLNRNTGKPISDFSQRPRGSAGPSGYYSDSGAGPSRMPRPSADRTQSSQYPGISPGQSSSQMPPSFPGQPSSPALGESVESQRPRPSRGQYGVGLEDQVKENTRRAARQVRDYQKAWYKANRGYRGGPRPPYM